MKRKKLCLDLDGCVLSFTEPFIEWITKNHPEVGTPNYETYDMGIADHFGELVIDFWDQGGLRDLSFIEGAKEAVFELDKKYDIHIATAVNPKYRADRVANLNGLPYKSMLLKDDGKAKWVIDNMKPDIAIDDKPANIRKFAAAGIDTYFPIWPYNKDVDVGTGFENWDELVKLLQ